MTETTYCANHPTVETSLRCNQCEKYICVKCAVRMPTGYRCKECVRGFQQKFDTAEWYDYLFGFVVTGFLSFIGSLLAGLVGFIGLWGIFILAAAAPTAGVIIAEAVRRVTRRHRSRPLFITVAVAATLGALPLAIVHLVTFDFFSLLFQLAYLVLVVPTIYSRISGIQIFK